ncbi:MAG: thermonuclease family protein [Planctomycetes bacterium]|nr:thermonuclease family protein [Planctomycetota bacterium]MBL7145735.1 thermonuclease family protein [Phycisphaerae bacterium]
MTHHKIIIGDSRCMMEVPEESVHLIITSPPYWQLKDYGNGSQIGFDDSYEDYINNLNVVWKECHRVLNKGCRLCVNIGDQFARSVYYGRYKVIPIRTEIIKFCETIGFDYMGAVIWQKVTTCNTTGGATIMGSFPFPRNGILKIDYEFILIFKKHGVAQRVSKEIKETSKMTIEEWNQFFTGHWNIPGEKQDKHLAMFPEEVPRRLIKMFSFVNDTVLDPFLGSGTTSLAAKKLNRNSIGYEINSEFLPLMKEKLDLEQQRIFEETDFEIIKQKKSYIDYKEVITQLPYIFKDPVEFDKKIDPRKLQFGSKINNHNSKREKYYPVKDVISPEKLVIGDGLKIKLLGIRKKPKMSKQAIQFLRDKTCGQKVFMKFDAIKHDRDNNLLCYLYLENKTFLNAHLIKRGLVDVDTSLDYKFKEKFLTTVEKN